MTRINKFIVFICQSLSRLLIAKLKGILEQTLMCPVHLVGREDEKPAEDPSIWIEYELKHELIRLSGSKSIGCLLEMNGALEKLFTTVVSYSSQKISLFDSMDVARSVGSRVYLTFNSKLKLTAVSSAEEDILQYSSQTLSYSAFLYSGSLFGSALI